MKKTLAAIGLLFGGVWAYNKYLTVNSSLDLIKIESPLVRDIGLKNGNVVFQLDLPVVNPESQNYTGKVISVRLYKNGEEIAYSEPGIVSFSIAPSARTLVRGITMNVPTAMIDTVLTNSSRDGIAYRADVEVAGVKLQFSGKLS
ncbi:hypothetical protein [Phaeocystidibacter marisrubri]|uniref:LEA type 2 family protein n=1 Tax=Phaeocystidibacter marisrubri TaxID=1577780 RepID=A0A6L3ZCT0_9FLAO|nr:hypothetical protein [Phaeocystidibacter marisrubri]KAB2815023.1 hypothetical protein F8C82_14600 [Phaeocystidibacter marisrubri]GGH78122.1 hypothetical protein GCM10011318_28870 [Phaeocystidibacter marisrubri]